MRILIVHNSYMQSGGEDRVVETEKALLRTAGHNVSEYRQFNQEIVDFDLWKKLSLGWRTTWSAEAFREVRAILDQFRPQVVHVHNTLPLISPSVYYACRSAHVAIVQTLHNYRLACPNGNLFRNGRVCEECVGRPVPWPGVVHGCYRNSVPRTLAVAGMLGIHNLLGTWSDLVHVYVALTEFQRRKCEEAGLPSEKLVVKPNCLLEDPEQRNGSGQYALFVGRLSEEKGLFTLMRAWKRLASVPLVIVGDGPLRELVRRMADEVTGGSIRVLGSQRQSVVLGAMREARFLVLPSECYEAFPITLVEAFACGLAVIGSRHGAISESVAHNDTGLLFRPGDEEDLAKSVQWGWDHPDEITAMGRRARATYEARYTGDRNYKELLNIYSRAIHAARTSVRRDPGHSADDPDWTGLSSMTGA